ncbi:hypothetical protein B0J12DRAFT_367129 [Macrophomina phaseolina]|uniref:Uncharacterized protein n=1 Tax=Macrophomina phaseolina TaxID=35725 RepID=A0ABQ8FW48_9PEZI|nr:hypothetical protein B0J12DRAFT_367129 [Macrophomina phaseolina]
MARSTTTPQTASRTPHSALLIAPMAPLGKHQMFQHTRARSCFLLNALSTSRPPTPTATLTTPVKFHNAPAARALLSREHCLAQQQHHHQSYPSPPRPPSARHSPTALHTSRCALSLNPPIRGKRGAGTADSFEMTTSSQSPPKRPPSPPQASASKSPQSSPIASPRRQRPVGVFEKNPHLARSYLRQAPVKIWSSPARRRLRKSKRGGDCSL